MQGRAIHAALKSEHGYDGSYSSVMRMLGHMRAARTPEVTVRLRFGPGQATQVDLGAGPLLVHPDGRARRTWAFVTTLAHSRHQYVGFVWNQTVATWLGCHRRALEWFAGVPRRIIVDNAKCAIIKVCSHDPLVQRAYAECAEGYGFLIDACPPHDPQKKPRPAVRRRARRRRRKPFPRRSPRRGLSVPRRVQYGRARRPRGKPNRIVLASLPHRRRNTAPVAGP